MRRGLRGWERTCWRHCSALAGVVSELVAKAETASDIMLVPNEVSANVTVETSKPRGVPNAGGTQAFIHQTTTHRILSMKEDILCPSKH